jgi:hypothetical protein
VEVSPVKKLSAIFGEAIVIILKKAVNQAIKIRQASIQSSHVINHSSILIISGD